jgi:beta-lactamase superfamily II metal-dependent hydrolase
VLFTLEPLQSLQGDCLLLHWGTIAAPKLAVIDGGPGNVYQDHLRPRLDSIRMNRGLQRLPIDLVMVSHVDNDHIVGVKKLFQQLKTEGQNQIAPSQRYLSVKRLWHNTFNDILGDSLYK